MYPYVILADDFTGAHDVGLPFTTHGFRTVVISHPDHLSAVDADVVVMDTDSRDCSAEEACRRVSEACRAIVRHGGRLIYKKIDSTLRGHIGQELDIVHDILGHAITIMAPAFPEIGRTTVGGYHLVNGIPVDRTAMSDDPGSPVTGAYIPDILGRQSRHRVEHIELRTILMGSEAVRASIEEISRPPHTTVVTDAATPDALKTILQAAYAMEDTPLLCGAAGLARHLVAWLAEQDVSIEKSTFPRPSDLPNHEVSGPVLVIAGSVNPVTIQQIEFMAKQPVVAVCHIDTPALLSEETYEKEIDRVVHLTVKDLSAGYDVILAMAPSGDIDRHTWIEQLQHDAKGRDLVTIFADALGIMGQRILEAANPVGLVLTGGETAEHVVRHLECQGTVIVDEVLDGVAKAAILGGVYDGLPIIVKPGAFGDRDGLMTSTRALRSGQVHMPVSGERPILGITIGDPNGIGPEIIVKILSSPGIYDTCRPLVIGNAEIIARHRSFVSVPLEINEVDTPGEGVYQHGIIDVLTVMDVDPDTLIPGRVQELAGRLAVESVIAATKLAMAGDIQAMVTASLNKAAMNLAGYRYAGHTELLAELTGTVQYRLTLAFDDILVSHVTTHVSLRQAVERLSEEGIVSTVEVIGQALKQMGIAHPRIAVAGLNPHAGEGGMFGDEEIRIITPAIDKAQAAGWTVFGPIPPDSIFFRALRGEFDGVVVMYHDQGHIPVKTIAFDRSVNISLGLPIIRTSVDHGTAFDIAGQGVADADNLGAAIQMAIRMAGGKTVDSEQ